MVQLVGSQGLLLDKAPKVGLLCYIPLSKRESRSFHEEILVVSIPGSLSLPREIVEGVGM